MAIKGGQPLYIAAFTTIPRVSYKLRIGRVRF